MTKTLYVDLDNTLVDFVSGIERLSASDRAEFEGRYDDAPGIFALMDPMPGAVQAYRELSQLFDTYILSTAPWDNPSAWSDKLLWVKRHLGGEPDDPAPQSGQAQHRDRSARRRGARAAARAGWPPSGCKASSSPASAAR